MSRTDTRFETRTTVVLPPALAGIVRTAPLAPAAGWEPTTLHPAVPRRTTLTGIVPLPGPARLHAPAAHAPKHLGRPDARREAPLGAVAAVLAAVVTAAVGSLTGVLTQRPPAVPAPGGTSVSAPASAGPDGGWRR